jgi:hypothetical protein
MAGVCGKCGAGLAAGQDWCLQCGAGASGGVGSSSWRAAAAVLGAVTALALGAAAAAYAALSKGPAKARVVTMTVAQATTTSAPPASAPATRTSATSTTGPATKGASGLGTIKPPKIPLTAITPKAGSGTGANGTATTTPATTTPATTTPATTPASTTPSRTNTSTGASETPAAGDESQQAAILLDTNAASTYNPYSLPASYFGDPSLAIDGDVSTAWTAQVDPATAPSMAEGLLIDLKAEQRVAVLQLVTVTPGMTVQVYGTKASSAPASITDTAWTALSGPKVVKKKRVRVALRDSKKAFTYVLLWISKAPASAVGTAEAPGHVSVNEVELFPSA